MMKEFLSDRHNQCTYHRLGLLKREEKTQTPSSFGYSDYSPYSTAFRLHELLCFNGSRLSFSLPKDWKYWFRLPFVLQETRKCSIQWFFLCILGYKQSGRTFFLPLLPRHVTSSKTPCSSLLRRPSSKELHSTQSYKTVSLWRKATKGYVFFVKFPVVTWATGRGSISSFTGAIR